MAAETRLPDSPPNPFGRTCLVVLNELSMRVLLRNTKTLRYCTSARGWVATAGQALEFASIPQAVRFALDEKLPGIEVVVEYNFLPEVVVPLQPEWCNFDPPRSAANWRSSAA